MKQRKNECTVITQPTFIDAGARKVIREYVGLVNTKTKQISIAHMTAMSGWIEPGQCPEFDEYILVLNGRLKVEWKQGSIDVKSGQAIICPKGVWVRFSNPEFEQTEYISICLPAFTPLLVNRDT